MCMMMRQALVNGQIGTAVTDKLLSVSRLAQHSPPPEPPSLAQKYGISSPRPSHALPTFKNQASVTSACWNSHRQRNESDFDTLTADELGCKYPYIQGSETRGTGAVTLTSTDGTRTSVATLPLSDYRLPNGVYDEMRLDGLKVQRTGLVDLATLTWNNSGGSAQLWRTDFTQSTDDLLK